MVSETGKEVHRLADSDAEVGIGETPAPPVLK